MYLFMHDGLYSCFLNPDLETSSQLLLPLNIRQVARDRLDTQDN